MYLNSLGTWLRSVTVGYGLRLHLFSFKINEVTVVTPLRGRACRRARAHAWRPKQKNFRARGLLQMSVTSVTSLIYNVNKCNRRP